MKVADANSCAEWQVYTFGSTLVLAKLVGNKDVSVAFDDIANTINGGNGATDAQNAAALFGCDTAGGQMGAVVNATSPQYQSPVLVNGGFTKTGIVLKVVEAPNVTSGKGEIFVHKTSVSEGEEAL